jgi:hypothetical protein
MIPRCFRQVWFVDTEFQQPDGERPRPICLVAREHYSSAVISQWLWGQPSPEPPFPTGPDVLVVAYSAAAEWSVYLALGWPLPVRILDLYAEYRWLTSGIKQPGYGQLDAMAAFGVPTMDELFKADMRSLCMRGGPFSPVEVREVLDYCRDDVNGLAALFEKMAPLIEWSQALARGRYTVAVAKVEALGVPVDAGLHRQLQEHRQDVCRQLVRERGEEYGIYADGEFDHDAFGAYLAAQDIPWPRTPTGRLVTRDDVFEDMLDVYPQLRRLHELRAALTQLKNDAGLAVGADGRNRSGLRPFASSSGRNAPSTTRFVFGKSTAFRSLIKPAPGWAVAYVDWSQQEFGIAAVLSGDANMLAAYRSGDVYLEFARQAGAVLPSAVKHLGGCKCSTCTTRDLFKTCMLGVNYSMGAQALARRIRRPLAHARELLLLHRQLYRQYWRWVERVQDQAMIAGRLETIFGWRVNVGPDANWRSLRNFPMQAHGAELMRLAMCLAAERGVRVVAPVHDAFLVEGLSVAGIDTAVRDMRRAMDEASRAVLDGLVLRTDVKIVRHPHRYRDLRGVAFWSELMAVLARVSKERKVSPTPPLKKEFVFIDPSHPLTPLSGGVPGTPLCTPTLVPHPATPTRTPTLVPHP